MFDNPGMLCFKKINYKIGETIMREGRQNNSMREITIVKDFTRYAEGSVLISFGNTKVMCNASVDEKIPPFIKEKGDDSGWVTAEYSMLPRSTHTRTQRERGNGGGRTQEIQRLIGRSMRSIVNLKQLGPRTITLDCDVLQADGGTRTASISGAYVALMLALKKLHSKGLIKTIPVSGYVAAVSVGKANGELLLDLDYSEDQKAEIDMNIIMTDKEEFIEVQGTGEAYPFSEKDLAAMIALAKEGVQAIIRKQEEALK